MVKDAKSNQFNFTFKFAEESNRKLIHEWLHQQHIQEWMHGVGLNNTLTGLEKFFRGETDTIYWIGYEKDIPFAFLITSPEKEDAMLTHAGVIFYYGIWEFFLVFTLPRMPQGCCNFEPFGLY